MGVGPFIQRDYWAAIAECTCTPSQLMELVRTRFLELPPPSIVIFERCDGDGELDLGDELDIRIRLAGSARVRVVHRDACSITLGTLAGHPEAGRITFGAYRNDDRQVLFHIRSRARASTRANYLGFLFGGDPMQTSRTLLGSVNLGPLPRGARLVHQGPPIPLAAVPQAANGPPPEPITAEDETPARPALEAR